jgi:putative transposase
MHNTSAELASRCEFVATEELRIANMTHISAGTEEQPGTCVAQKAGLNREILDTAPALFTSLLR